MYSAEYIQVHEKEERKKQACTCTCTYCSLRTVTFQASATHMHVAEQEFRKDKICRNNTHKAKQRTPKAVTFPRKNELPQVGLEPTTPYTLDRALYQLSY